ncbi:hypothetical protein DFH09DRAFT_1136837 [Mycena vulgaris]|nr:hypothetical protein DFH09DRAFT_1136837 [Mycena vulgaris]
MPAIRKINGRATKPVEPYNGGDIGGRGGIGQGLRFGKPLASMEEQLKAKVPRLRLDTEGFCQTYSLGDEICELLKNSGFETAGALLEVSDTTLKKAKFKLGHVAELKWALKKMVSKGTAPRTASGNLFELVGGSGGAGGAGVHRGGEGGLGEAFILAEEDMYYFGALRGGIGGQGGANGRKDGFVGIAQLGVQQTQGKRETETEPKLPWLYGGTGGVGGEGGVTGGAGGLGEGAMLDLEHTVLFSRIAGGAGGAGGQGGFEGGSGGTGQGPRFSRPLVRIYEGARSRVPTAALTALDISEHVRGLVRAQGFVTVGALLEVDESDLEDAGFAIDHIAGLNGALKQFLSGKGIPI